MFVVPWPPRAQASSRDTPMATVYSFHGGPPLNVWERCSLQSFADQGHETVLFSYDRLDVPRGVRLESADSIISIEERDKFFAVAPDQYSQFSDFFRYELLHQRGGWWIDTDVLCRSPTLPSQPVVVGENSTRQAVRRHHAIPRRASPLSRGFGLLPKLSAQFA